MSHFLIDTIECLKKLFFDVVSNFRFIQINYLNLRGVFLNSRFLDDLFFKPREIVAKVRKERTEINL